MSKFQSVEEAVRKMDEAGTVKARWVKDSGPGNVGGFDLQKKTPKGWSSVGFIKTKDKPKDNSGVVDIYNGTKTIKVDLGDYKF